MPQGSERTLTFVTTDRCTANCAHCLMNSRKDLTARLSATEMVSAYRKARASHDVEVAVFSGGEPTTLGEELLEAIAEISLDGVLTRVVTNCSWAVDDEATVSMVADLRAAGLHEINYSVDDFHAVWVPFGNVERAWRASTSVGFTSVVVNVAEGPRSCLTAESVAQRLGGSIPVQNSEDPVLPAPMADGTRYLVCRSRISRLGRGRKLKRVHAAQDAVEELPGGPCHLATAGSVITASNRVAVCCGADPERNHVLAGASLREHVWEDAVSDLSADPIVQGLRVLGPRYLILLAESLGSVTVPRRPPYTNLCEACESLTLCTDAVTVLREHPGAIQAGLALVQAVTPGTERDH